MFDLTYLQEQGFAQLGSRRMRLPKPLFFVLFAALFVTALVYSVTFVAMASRGLGTLLHVSAWMAFAVFWVLSGTVTINKRVYRLLPRRLQSVLSFGMAGLAPWAAWHLAGWPALAAVVFVLPALMFLLSNSIKGV